MHIVPAGVHDGNVAACIILGADLAGIGEACFFLDRKRVEFGAQHDRRAGAIFQDGDNACAADAFRDVVAELAETVGKFGGGLRFVRREFRILVQVQIEGAGVGINNVDFGRSGGILRVGESGEGGKNQGGEKKKFPDDIRTARLTATTGGNYSVCRYKSKLLI